VSRVSAPPGIVIALPGAPITIRNLMLDLNGTLARDGHLLAGVAQRVAALRERVGLVLASGDTFGTAAGVAEALGVEFVPLGEHRQTEQKLALLERLGRSHSAVIGNGRNDARALAAARLAIVVCGPEGAAREALANADVVVGGPADALDLLLAPARLVATLRP